MRSRCGAGTLFAGVGALSPSSSMPLRLSPSLLHRFRLRFEVEPKLIATSTKNRHKNGFRRVFRAKLAAELAFFGSGGQFLLSGSARGRFSGATKTARTARDRLLRARGRPEAALGRAPAACFGALGGRLGSQSALGTDFGSILGRFGLDFGSVFAALQALDSAFELAVHVVPERLQLTARAS